MLNLKSGRHLVGTVGAKVSSGARFMKVGEYDKIDGDAAYANEAVSQRYQSDDYADCVIDAADLPRKLASAEQRCSHHQTRYRANDDERHDDVAKKRIQADSPLPIE